MPVMKNVTPPQWQVPRFSFGWVWRVVAALIVIWAIFSCFSQVPTDSKGVLIRLGKFQEPIVPSGLRFKLPLGIDELELVATERQMKLEFGFATEGASNGDQTPEDPEAEQSMVTGDLNMALVEWVLQYRIDDPKSISSTCANRAHAARRRRAVMREVIGDRTVDEVLTIGRQEIERNTAPSQGTSRTLRARRQHHAGAAQERPSAALRAGLVQ